MRPEKVFYLLWLEQGLGEKMPILYEEFNFRKMQVQSFPQGWTRTLILALGGTAGVLLTASAIHIAKRGKPAGLSGWPRTLVLAGGAFAGTMATATIIHFRKQGKVPIVEEI